MEWWLLGVVAISSFVALLALLGALVSSLLLFCTRSFPCFGKSSNFDLYAGLEHTIAVDVGGGIRGYWTPNQAGGAVVIYTHGHSKSILKQGEGGINVVDRIGAPVFRAGFSILGVDLRNHGDSPYRPPVTCGVRESEDILAAYDWLQREHGYSAESIGLAGISMGAATVLFAAASNNHRVQAVVVDSPLASFDATFEMWLSHKIGNRLASVSWWYLRWWFSLLIRCTSPMTLDDTDVAVAVRSSTAAILHSHGKADPIVPFGNALLLAEAARSRVGPSEYEFFEYELGHTQAWKISGYNNRMIEFFRRHLAPCDIESNAPSPPSPGLRSTTPISITFGDEPGKIDEKSPASRSDIYNTFG
ncbi:hypothetical protein CYMTET_38571 [Cymbomonas tetramitiformis]|uniref:AB hydrolase-1 domain-containing protein n=1 Tax=Cymbomonas tetramitiformis TaxID=36881 RepID=A0AAE0CDB0_9CHLO|nr:hypothetical protein CYMTET_38571 [Cymbomonas tetramitiformis]|eukprot:gene26767-32888_t